MSASLTRSLPNAVKSLSVHISTAADREQEQPLWDSARRWLQGVTCRDWTQDQVVEEIAQALVCIDAYLAAQGSSAPPRAAWNWLRQNANPFWEKIFRLPIVDRWLRSGRLPKQPGSNNHRPDGDTPVSFEEFLADHDPACRTENGVFYTPLPVVRWIVRSADRQIQQAFPGSTGLAPMQTKSELAAGMHPGASTDELTCQIEILDPAAGTGVFLIEVIEQVACRMKAAWKKEGWSKAESSERWNHYVARSLLPRLTGFELMLPAALLGQVMMIQKLADTGFDFRERGQLQFHVMDTLAEPVVDPQATDQDRPSAQADRELQDHLRTLEHLRLHRHFTVILGNPPFSGVSRHDVLWIGQLLRGQEPVGTTSRLNPLANYYQVDGEPLGERKVWLQDDYVKFLRYCHWKIEQSGMGLVGLVTNHGYLDGPSFRGLRQSLCETFTRIKIVDLHGNQKKKECTPEGGSDENVFPISSGIAIGLFCRGSEQAETVVVEHQDLWGSGSQKLAVLKSDEAASAAEIKFSPLDPTAPYYFLLPHDDQVRDEYQAGFSLCDIMTERTTAAVTARDGFVVGFDQQEILERLALFRDPAVSDSQLRERFFTNSRSSKYPPGDTRSWKLAAARATLSADPDWRARLRTCFYRPFDRRAVYWAPWMIDWPRTAIMKHMLELPNLALVARRQMLPSRPCNFFWVTDSICLDGLIRSDNRGSESIFPLYLSQPGAAPSSNPVANFNRSFIDVLQDHYGWGWLDSGNGNLRTTCGPLDIFYMIYAQFHSAHYRRRYATWLRIDFPRLFLPRSQELFRLLVAEGEELVEGHLLRRQSSAEAVCFRIGRNSPQPGTRPAISDLKVAASYPRYESESVWINPHSCFQEVTRTVWEFEVGGYQVCRKWLADRRGRQLKAPEIDQYQSLVRALSDTVVRMQTIDQMIDRFGGWPGAFAGNLVNGANTAENDRREIA